MTKSDLIDAVSDQDSTFSRKEVEVVVNTIFDAMAQSMVRDERVEIRRFGSFSVRRRDARLGRNPRTGETVSIPERRVPFFTAGKDLRERVDRGR